MERTAMNKVLNNNLSIVTKIQKANEMLIFKKWNYASFLFSRYFFSLVAAPKTQVLVLVARNFLNHKPNRILSSWMLVRKKAMPCPTSKSSNGLRTWWIALNKPFTHQTWIKRKVLPGQDFQTNNKQFLQPHEVLGRNTFRPLSGSFMSWAS